MLRTLVFAVTLAVSAAAPVGALPPTARADAAPDRPGHAVEQAVGARPPTAATDGLAIPLLAGGVAVAFAVGIGAGTVHNRRRSARRRVAAEPVTEPRRPAEPPVPRERRKRARKPLRRAKPPTPPTTARPQAAEPSAAPEPPRAAEPPAPEPPPVTRPRPAAPAPRPRRSAPPRPVPREPARAAYQWSTPSPELPRIEARTSLPLAPERPLNEAPEAVWVQPAARPVGSRRSAPIADWPPDAQELWTCEIDWKAGYRKSSFRAVAGPPGTAGKLHAIGESAPVRWTFMSDPQPPTPELAIRVRALVDALDAAGWEHIGRGRRWYAQRFVWRGEGEPQPLDVRDVAEPPER